MPSQFLKYAKKKFPPPDGFMRRFSFPSETGVNSGAVSHFAKYISPPTHLFLAGLHVQSRFASYVTRPRSRSRQMWACSWATPRNPGISNLHLFCGSEIGMLCSFPSTYGIGNRGLGCWQMLAHRLRAPRASVAALASAWHQRGNFAAPSGPRGR